VLIYLIKNPQDISKKLRTWLFVSQFGRKAIATSKKSSLKIDRSTTNKIYDLIGKIYDTLGNKDLSQKFLNPNLRLAAANSLKDELSGIYRKNQ